MLPPSLLRPILALVAALPVACLVGCGDPDAQEQPDDRLRTSESASVNVVCTTTMIGDIVSEVVGDLGDVHVMFGPTVDPHLFRATRDDVAKLMGADLVICNGFGLEGHLEPHLRRVAEVGIDLLEVAPAILQDGEALKSEGVPDPHLWMDPLIWQRMATAVADAMEAELGDASPPLRGRAEEVAARLQSLHQYAEGALHRIPESSRVLVTAHDAFGYFGRRYGLRVEAIQGLSTASEGGLHAIESLVDLLVEDRIPAVFFESTISERNVKALVEGAQARGHTVGIGGVLHSDAPGTAGNYEAMMRHNIDTITAALGDTGSNSTGKIPNQGAPSGHATPAEADK